MDLQNMTYFDKVMQSATATKELFENSTTFTSTLDILSEVTTMLATSNETNQSSTTVAKPEDPGSLLPFALVSVRNICVHYLTFIIWMLSFPANISIIYILMQKNNRNCSTSVYFISLAAADLVVNFRTLLFWLDKSKLVIYSSSFECKLSRGLPMVGMIGSSWTLALISIERMLNVCFPFKVKYVCKANVAKVCITGIWIVSLTVASIEAWFNDLNGSRCEIKRNLLAFFVEHVVYIYFTLDIAAPFTVILVNSIIMVSRLALMKARSSASSKAFGTSVTVLVLVVSLVFFITQFPYGVIFVVQQTKGHFASQFDPEFISNLEDIFLVLKYVNNGINFYLYFLTASKFRREAKEAILPCTSFCSGLCKRREQTESSTGSNS